MTSKPSTTNCPKLSHHVISSVVDTVSISVLLVEIVTLHALSDREVVMNIPHYSFLITHLSVAINQVVIAAGSHLFPFRTEKLSPPAPMVLQCNAGE